MPLHITRIILLPTTGLNGSARATFMLSFRCTLKLLRMDLSDGILHFMIFWTSAHVSVSIILKARSGLYDYTRCTTLHLFYLEEVVLWTDRLRPIV